MSRIIFPLIIFCSAFLLFQIQPMLSKEQLFQFGGGASVWTSSLLFYQTALLCGYLYAHGLSRLSLQRQWLIHLTALCLACCVTFYPLPPQHLTEPSADSPVFLVMTNLFFQIGLVFMLLSATSVLVQRWYTQMYNASVPYSWYGWSNWGALLALFSYPLVVEFYFTIAQQKHYWLCLLAVLLASKIVALYYLNNKAATGVPPKYVKHNDEESINETPVDATLRCDNQQPTRRVLLWLCLSACSSLCLISTTQMLSTNIPPMPLLWNLPLAIYLLTFALAFSRYSSLFARVSGNFVMFAVFFGLLMAMVGSQFNTLSQFTVYCFILAVVTMICHCFLHQLAPEPAHMTRFYLCIATGGALGSLFSALAAPQLFHQIVEYPIALLGMLGLYLYLKVSQSKITGVQKNALFAGACSVVGFIAVGLSHLTTQFVVASERNFYGYIAVKEINTNTGRQRILVDGTTIHGSEHFNHDEPDHSSYYNGDSGVVRSLALLNQNKSLNTGIIGLGAGALAQYADSNDQVTFYELNPSVHHFAQAYFSYLTNATANIDVVIGDGRMSLRKEQQQQRARKDALIIDAFSSDLIPTHLLTQQAFDLYWQRLTQDGVILLHISNNHIDLMPVLRAHCQHYQKTLVTFNSNQKSATSGGAQISQWVAITDNSDYLEVITRDNTAHIDGLIEQEMLPWTDERHSLLPLLKI